MLVGKKEFTAADLNLEDKAFMVYIASIVSSSSDPVHSLHQVQIAQQKVDEAFIAILSEYADFLDIFSLDLTVKLQEHTGINNHVIKLIDDKPPPYGSIYSLGPVELETLKTYIKTNLINSFK